VSPAAIALLISIGSTIFAVGLYFGSLRGRLDRTRERLRDHDKRLRELEGFMRRSQVRSRDIEKSFSVIAQRPFLPRFPEDQEPAGLLGETPHTGVAKEPEPGPKK
jgi:hypothetical protein